MINYTDALLVLSDLSNADLKKTDDMYGKVMLNTISPDSYKFLRYVGVGLDGIIILAEDFKDMRNVIFKFAKPQKSNQKRMDAVKEKAKLVFKRRLTIKETTDTRRFLRSALIQQKISEFIKNDARASSLGRVPEIYDVGKSPYLYIKMEYIEGSDLLDWCMTENNVKTRVKIVRDACELIKIAMHDKNIIHSDLKPSNFLVSGTDEHYRIIILDFSGAKDMSDSFQVTVAEDTRYSLPYTSKNQIDNYSLRTFSDDVYSMGVVFYNCITQKTPEQLIMENPCATNFFKMYPQHNLKTFEMQSIFNRATGQGFKYNRFDEMIQDIDEKILGRTKDTSSPSMTPNLIKILEDYLANARKYKERIKDEKMFFDIIDD